MRSSHDLKTLIQRINGRGYKAYKDLKGIYDFSEHTLLVDHVQGDPFAAPSRVRVRVPQSVAGFPGDTYSGKSREVGLRDFLTRQFCEVAARHSRRRGTGTSGIIAMDRPSQEILERSSFFVSENEVEARFVVGLPAFGRKIAGAHAESLFFEDIPAIVQSLRFENLDAEKLYEHVKTNEDADFLRGKLADRGLVAFIADGSSLPRRSGIDPRPLKENVVLFQSPESMRVTVDLPNRGTVTGMGIPYGVILIVGGGYHGKSTLLKALELGVYNHVPGDGRELVVTNYNAVKIRAEDGRRIEKVNISPFISNLPFSQDTRSFSTEDASGSTSQAANIMEYLEVGAQVLLIDEDTSATNFMIRDHRMQELVVKEQEPITPFIDKVQSLFTDHGVSTILVLGGSGDYFDVADVVICMSTYRPQDLTGRAHEIAGRYKTERVREGGTHFGEITQRIPVKESIDPGRGNKPVKIAAKGLRNILFGRYMIDLQAVEQIVDAGQTRCIGDAVFYVRQCMDGRSLRDIVYEVEERLTETLDVFGRPVGDHAVIRRFELAAALNRLRSLKVLEFIVNDS
jgi:predicted ABC-class ATPase